MTSSSSKDLICCSIGGNLPGTAEAFAALYSELQREITDLRVSQVYRTAPQDYHAQPDFFNWVFSGYSSLDPEAFLNRTQDWEQIIGRVRDVPRGPRLIDIDILVFGDHRISSGRLTIPHPRMQDRAFVLIPLSEVASHLTNPLNGEPWIKYLSKLPDQGIYSLGVYPYNLITHGTTRSGINASFPAKGF